MVPCSLGLDVVPVIDREFPFICRAHAECWAQQAAVSDEVRVYLSQKAGGGLHVAELNGTENKIEKRGEPPVGIQVDG